MVIQKHQVIFMEKSTAHCVDMKDRRGRKKEAFKFYILRIEEGIAFEAVESSWQFVK